jgi:hypothetical protein
MMCQPSQHPVRTRRPERLRARPVLHASTPLACDQVAGKRAQVGMDLRAPWEPVRQGMAGQYRSLAGEHQVRFAARGLCGQQMLQVVTAGGHAVQVKSVALADLLEQPRKRLAAGATVVGGMGQKKTASTRAPTAASILCMREWMVLSVATSIRPRPRPGWLEATAT